MARSFKFQYLDSIKYEDIFVAQQIAEYYGHDTTAGDLLDTARKVVADMRRWEFDDVDSFMANLEEYVMEDDEMKTAVFDAFQEAIEFFDQEVFMED